MAVLPFLRKGQAIPAEHRRNFGHLYLDIAWYGVLNASAISFVAVYAARQGGTAFHLGLLSAGPAIVNLLLTLPAGQWLGKRQIDRSVFWTSVWHRLFYLPWVFLPLLLAPHVQVWALIGLTLLMSIPGTALAVGFNALFATAVPPEWRGHVAGVRNSLLAVVFIVTSLLCGLILEYLPFEAGYQVVFALGFLGAMLSSYHLWRIRLPLAAAGGAVTGGAVNGATGHGLGDLVQPGTARAGGHNLRTSVGLRYLTRRLRLQVGLLRNGYGRVVALLFAFHLAQFLAIPLFPLYWVERLRLSDQTISLGNAIFFVAVLLGSLQLAHLTRRLGHRRLLALGVSIMGFYPLLTTLTRTEAVFLATAVVGGLGWSLVGGAIANYLLERIPDDNRPAYLAWYNLGLNAAILLGALGGPLLAEPLGLAPVLLLATAGRFLVARSLWRWG